MSTHTLYRDGQPCGSVDISDEVLYAAQKVAAYLGDHPGAQICGLIRVVDMERQLEGVRRRLRDDHTLVTALQNRLAAERALSQTLAAKLGEES